MTFVEEALAYGVEEIKPRGIAPLGKTKLYEEIKAGRLKAVKVGRRTMILRSELERYLAELGAAS